MKKEPFLLAKKLTSLEQTKNTHTYLRKKVYSVSGDPIGRVVDIILENDIFIGIIVKGKKRLFIDKDYCEDHIEDSIMLTIDPVTLLKGKLVIDGEGKRLGKVVGFTRNNVRNSCQEILIKKNIFKKPYAIPFSKVQTAKKNIILKKE